MVSGLGKLVGKVVNTILGKHGLLDQLRFQFLGCRDGSCRLVHAGRTAFEEGEIRTVVVALDMANAYNSVSRRAMIEEMADDTTLVGPRRSAFKAAQMLAERLSTVGLRMNADKTQVLCKRGQLERTKARIRREMKRSRDDPGSPPSVLEGCHLTERSVAVLQCPVGEELPPEVALEHSMKRLEKEFGPAAERLLAGIEVCGLKRAHHLLLSVVGQKFSYLHRAAGAAAGQELAVFHAALLANLSAVAHKTELDAIGHALSDEMCTVTEDGFREAMSKAIEALVRGLPDEHARREAWWALLGREADGVTRLASAASNPALKKGGYAQMRLAKMLSRGCKAGGMGLPGVAQFRFEATAGFIEAPRADAAQVYSVRQTPAIGLARDGPDADADGNDPNWKGISLKKLVRSSLKRSDRSDATKEVGDILLRCEEVAKGAYRDYERDSKEYKDACTEARYFRPDKDCVVGKEADLHAARVKKRYQLAHVWRSDIAGAVEGLEELRAEIEELALEAMMELRSDDESSDDMEAAANLVEEFIRACKGARCLAAATGFEGFLPDTLDHLGALNAEGWDAVLALLRSPVGPELVCLRVYKLKSRQAEDLARLIREPEARPVELRLSLGVPLPRLGESTRSVMKALRDKGWPRRFQFFRVCSCSDDMAAMIAESMASGQAECVCMAQCDLSAAAVTAIAAALPRCPGLRQLNLDNDPMTEPAAVSLIEAMLGLHEARMAVALKGACGCVTSAAGQERLLELLSSTGHRGLRLGGLIEGTKDMPEPLRSAAARRTALQRSWDGSWGARCEAVLWRRAMEGRR
ncbi:hypothetical protein FNF29_08481 [Cafeteria roenbergensis]|uniref:Uncharacterized protein n=1 Tax=Cafeteria roenbergensis TaxID=33653 RepID=A0A5A8BXU7_CAFRO|nr:hypothetical protein FNF29_08481 [Cafeteria roenbergensis]|eukprot:KAA0145562.1 hypothetical protein FNF29_08481 [Cafeteria roenbergensis]